MPPPAPETEEGRLLLTVRKHDPRPQTVRGLLAPKLAGRVAPTALAVTFGLVSIPFVTFALLEAPPSWQQVNEGWPPVDLRDVLLLATVAALGAAVIGGTVGGWLVRRRPVLATLVAVALSWPVGIALLPAVAAALGIDFRAAMMCIDACHAQLTSASPSSGVAAYVQLVVGGGYLVLPLLLAMGLAGGAAVAARSDRVMTGSAFIVAAYAVFHGWSLLLGGAIPFACLAFGVGLWTYLLHGSDVNAAPESPSAKSLGPAQAPP